MVIAILGIMAGLTVPVLKNFAKSDATLGASRQLLDGVARARQLAISQRTTVYMVFVPPNFWNDSSGPWPLVQRPDPGPANRRHQSVRQAIDRLHLCWPTARWATSRDNTPGIILRPWQTLPDGTFIALAKFTNSPNGTHYTITDSINPGKSYNIYGFATNAIPFPTATNACSVDLSLSRLQLSRPTDG